MVTANAKGFTVTAKRGFECDFQKDTKVAYIYIYIYIYACAQLTIYDLAFPLTTV